MTKQYAGVNDTDLIVKITSLYPFHLIMPTYRTPIHQLPITMITLSTANHSLSSDPLLGREFCNAMLNADTNM